MEKLSARFRDVGFDWLILLLAALSFLTLYLPGSLSSGSAILAIILISCTEPRFIQRFFIQYRGPIILVFLILAMAISFSSLPFKTSKAIYDLLRAFLLLLIFSYLGAKLQSGIILRGISFLACLFLIVFFMNMFLEAEPSQSMMSSANWAQILRTSYSRNIIATQICLALIPIVCVLLDREVVLSKLEQSLYSLCVAASGFAILLSLSRGTLLAAGVTVLVAGFVFHQRKAILCFFSAVLILLFAALLLPAQTLAHNLVSGLYRGGDLLTARTEIYSATFDFILKAPWFGYGPGTFKHLGVVGAYTHPHSMYLELLFSFGVIGSSGLIAGFLWLSRRSAKISDKDGPLFKFSLILFVFFMTRGIFDIHLFVYDTWAVLFIVLGGVCCGPSVKKVGISSNVMRTECVGEEVMGAAPEQVECTATGGDCREVNPGFESVLDDT